LKEKDDDQEEDENDADEEDENEEETGEGEDDGDDEEVEGEEAVDEAVPGRSNVVALSDEFSTSWRFSAGGSAPTCSA
jgi:hypothetical protein